MVSKAGRKKSPLIGFRGAYTIFINCSSLVPTFTVGFKQLNLFRILADLQWYKSDR